MNKSTVSRDSKSHNASMGIVVCSLFGYPYNVPWFIVWVGDLLMHINLHMDFGRAFVDEILMSSGVGSILEDNNFAARSDVSLGRSSISVVQCRSSMSDRLTRIHGG